MFPSCSRRLKNSCKSCCDNVRNSEEYHLLIDKYKEIVTKNYAEPKKEEILGSFLGLLPLPIQMPKGQKSIIRVTAKKEKRKTQGQDIRKMFRKIAEKNERR